MNRETLRKVILLALSKKENERLTKEELSSLLAGDIKDAEKKIADNATLRYIMTGEGDPR